MPTSAQDDFDRLLIAWDRLQRMVNQTLPNQVDQLLALRNKIAGVKPPGPTPV